MFSVMRSLLSVVLLFSSQNLLGSPEKPAPVPSRVWAPAPVGKWYAKLLPTPDHPVEFELRITSKAGTSSALLVNDVSEMPFTSAAWNGKALTLEMAHFDARIVAERKGNNLEGTYSRTTAAGLAEVPFVATKTAPSAPREPKAGGSVAGSWGIEMGEGKEIERLTGIFRQSGGSVSGTMLSTTGDYGPLHGTFDGESLVLMVFDGVHVYRFEGELLSDGSLAGEFRSRTSPPVSWRGRKLDAGAAEKFLPGAFDIVKPRSPEAPYTFSYADAAGRPVTSGDAQFAGKPVIVTLMGTWCPNCNDEAPVLRDLYARYAPKGLAVVALSFEYTDELERNRRQVRRFVERYGIRYPVLLAGTTRSAPSSPAMTQLEGWPGYPTTLFLDRRHHVVRIHSGFDGPATGERFGRLKKEMEGTVEGLLKAGIGAGRDAPR
jgi:thiol-disulfide isomerase/thioredoxin